MDTFDAASGRKTPDPDDILDMDLHPGDPHRVTPSEDDAPVEGGDVPHETAQGLNPSTQAHDPPSFPSPTTFAPASRAAAASPNGAQASVDAPFPGEATWSQEPEAASEAEGNWFGLFLRELFETVGLAIIIFLIIRIGIQNYRIEGQSMEPNFHDGEYLIVNKLAYRLGEYERGDVIVFHYPNDPTKDYIKRVIGLPGDVVEIRGGVLYVNNMPVEEPYDHMPMIRDEPPVLVEPGHLYVLGDNRPASSDTRSWGLLPQDLVIGKAWLAIWPPSIFGVIDHPVVQVGAAMPQGP
ncbi:MAG: signal peptidase I [Caldilineae bacterium]|nr:MAG: signal peptidase I [Caldilineae bacterium]